MNSFYFSLEQSAWWLLAIIAVSAGLSWLFYSGKNIWNKRLKLILGSLRFISIFLILFLLLNPSITSIISFREKPVFPLLIDNSQSAILAGEKEIELKKNIYLLSEKIKSKGFDAQLFVHGNSVKSIDSFSFSHKSSDLETLLTTGDESVADKKDTRMLLISDGIFNTGISPVYQSFSSDIFSLGYGDTVPRKDFALKSIQNNAVAFLGNKFTIRANVQATGLADKTMEVTLKNSTGVTEQKLIPVKGDFFEESLDFIVLADKKGFQRYTIAIKNITGESNLLNNTQNAYVEIVDDKENILIVSSSPHPNIKAIKTALLKEENINIDVLIPGISNPKTKNYDLVILHNCLANSIPEASPFIKETTSLLYIAGSETDYGKFNSENGLVDVFSRNQTDQAQAALNPSFSKFKMNEEAGSVISGLPPLEVTFGEVKLKGGADILLYQKINGIQTEKPMLVLGNIKRKTGVLLTDGIWLWRMYESQARENSKNTDEIITKTIQFLSSKQDKRKFRIYPYQKEYFEGDRIQIETELYNDLYERVAESAIRFSLSSENKKAKTIDFNSSEGNTALSLNSLPAGVYRISATAQFAGKTFSSSTEFIVKERQLESLDLRANHQLLRELSNKNGGAFYSLKQINGLIAYLDKLQAKPIWKSTEKTRELINEVWYFCLIFACLTAEWIIRRYTGGY